MKKKTKEINASNTILGKDSDFEGNMEFFGGISRHHISELRKGH
jgi:hypothetical protein